MYNEGINHLYVCPIAVDSVFNARKTGLCGNRETSNIGIGLVRRDLTYVSGSPDALVLISAYVCACVYIYIYVCVCVCVYRYIYIILFRPSRPALRSTQPPVQWVFPGGKVRPGRATDHSPPSSAAVMEG